MAQAWADFLRLPLTAQIALVGAGGFFASFLGLLLLLHGRQAWYHWRREVWCRGNLWPDGEPEPGPFGLFECDLGHRVPYLEGQPYTACPICVKERRRLNGLVEVRRERVH